ncbi:MAG: YdcF family protein [Tissierellia bacterium]|nr:YdcF family protein [Tissierellia bacterium]
MKKLFLIFLALLVFLGGIYIYGQKQSPLEVDLILVFGASVVDSEPSETLLLRSRAAGDYLEDHPRAKALLLGGRKSGEDISEARAMATYLISLGIDKNRLILEEQSTSTWTNLKNAKLILEETLGLQPVMVCSSDYHMLRINFLAARLDMETYPLPVSTPIKLFIVSYFREVAALIKSFLFDR